MLYKKTVITLAVLGLVLAGGVASSYAFQGNPNVQPPNYSTERHRAVMDAFSNNDYQAWKELVAARRVAAVIDSQEKFDKLTEAHQVALAGDLEKAKEIRQELGLPAGLGRRAGKRMMRYGARIGGHFIDNNHDGVCDKLDLNQ